MLKHFQASAAELDLHPADDRHVGDMVNRWRHCYVNGLLEIGFSDFKGDMWMPALPGYHGMLVMTSGTGDVYEGDTKTSFVAGDIFVFEPPVGDVRIVSPGCTYAYMTQWHDEESRAAVAQPPA